MWQLSLTLAVFAASGPQSAHRLYRSGDYDRACPLFEKETRLRPRDGAAWADLAICEEKRGDREKARHANALAIRWGNERTRKHAYFNLWQMEAALEFPGPRDTPRCRALRAAPELECSDEIWSCVYGQIGLGAKGHGSHVYAKLDPCDGRCERPLLSPDVIDSEHLEVEGERTFEGNRVLLHRSVPGFTCEKLEDGSDICGLSRDENEKECDIVSVDPCNRRVGYVCFNGYDPDEDGNRTPRRPRAFEKHLSSLGCPDEPEANRPPLCDEARLARAEREARDFGKTERFECQRKRLERLQQQCGPAFSGPRRARLAKLLADNAFRRGDFPRCRALLQDARPEEPSRVAAWAESLGRCGGDCSGEDMPPSCDNGSTVYQHLTDEESEPCEIAGHGSARRVWSYGEQGVRHSCLGWAWPEGPPPEDGKTAVPCPRLQLVQQRQDSSISTRVFEPDGGLAPGTAPLCCRAPNLRVLLDRHHLLISIEVFSDGRCPTRGWRKGLTWDGKQLWVDPH
jgi:hypothetical protein